LNATLPEPQHGFHQFVRAVAKDVAHWQTELVADPSPFGLRFGER
jgi:hypothetical protein